VKNGGCWRISGGVMFNARSVSLDWSFSNKNLPSAVAGLFWSGLVIFRSCAVRLWSVCDPHAPVFKFCS
jgi:hypothetical protein